MVYLVMMPFLYSLGTRSHLTSTLVLFNTVTLLSEGATEGPATKDYCNSRSDKLFSFLALLTGRSTFSGK